MGSNSIPIIDLQDFPSQSQNLIKACEEFGCFRITNHQIPVTLMAEMKSVARSLLDLPIEIKRRNFEAIQGSGYLAPTNASPLLEGLGLYDWGSSEVVQTFFNQIDASPQQRETILQYSKHVNKLVMDIGRKLAQSMGLGCDLFMGWPYHFKLLKYHFTQETVGSLAAQIHTDSSFFTILQDDENVGGLEVIKNDSGAFLPIVPLPGTFVVNLGDIATVWSNGRFCNVKHRVKCKEASIRVSIAMFIIAPNEVVVEAPPELVDSDHPRLYVPLNYEDYRKLRNSTRMIAGEVLDLLRATNSVRN